jgi:hypothetical protein
MAATRRAGTKKAKAKSAPAAVASTVRHRIFGMSFAKIYPAWLHKVERKKRSREELDQVISWLTGYTAADLREWIAGEDDLGSFLDHAPSFNPAAKLITGTVCGVRVEEVAEPSMRQLRQLDKLVDELAQGRPMEKILRRASGA